MAISKMNGEVPANTGFPIAVVGMSCRLPGGISSPSKLWEACFKRESAWSPIPEDRFSLPKFYHPNPGKSGCFPVRGGHFLKEDLAHFDARFFNTNVQEAEAMDPQQRLLLECAYEALENAGIPMENVANTDTGVYMASSSAEYLSHLLKDTDNISMYQPTGSLPSILSNRISYFFNMKGPSMTVDTGCSASLVALHVACQSLARKESKIVLVGGAHILLGPEFFISMGMAGFFSEDGRSYAFDDRACGFGRGEGSVCVVLKPLSEALKNGDPIRAVIRNTGVNQDGRTPGITMPSGESQRALIRSVYSSIGLDPADTQYVEAHGTGTAVGDPIEAKALAAEFCQSRLASEPLLIGSVKTNIGHLEGASGLAGLIKTVLMLENNSILPNINFKNPNPSIPMEILKVKIPTEVISFQKGMLKRASVNGFGFGGTNAHAVVESARHYLGDIAKESLKNCDVKLGKRRIYVLSAHKKESAQTQRARLVKYLNARHGGTDSTMMEDLAYTLSERRSRLAWNLAIQASSIQELTECLGSDRYQAMKQTVKPNLAFIFTGQGAQWARMGMELMIYPQFQQVIKEASELLQEIGAKWSLLGEHRLFTNETKAYRSILEELSQNTPETRVNESIVSQPACTAIQLGLLELLASWNIKPQVAIGHSSGEIAAAYAAGAFDRDVAISIAYYRGTLAEKAAQVHHGSMLAIGAGREIVDPFLQNLKMGKVVIACENSPESVTASGDVEAILELQVLMNERGLFNRKLATSCAYHSPHMACIADDYRKKLADLPKSRKSGDGIRFYSSLHGGSYPVASLNADYWVENLVCPVKFFDAMSALLSDSLAAGGEEAVNTLLEIGPHPALQQPTKTIIQSVTKADKFTYLPTLLRGKDDVFNMLEVARRMFMEGLPVELREVNQASANTSRMILTDLPPYPWTHVDRYWIETRYTQNSRFSQFPRNDVLGTVNLDSIGLEPTWRNTISVNDLPWLKPLSATTFEYPISGYVSMAVEAVYQLAIQTNVEFDDIRLQNMEIVEPLELPAGTTFETQITLRPAHVKDASGAPDIRKWHAFEIFSWTNEEGWRHHCRGLAIVCESSWKNPIDGDLQKKAAERNWMSTCRNIEVACNEEIDGVQFYRSLEQGLGAELSECLKGVQRIHMSHLESLVEVLLPNSAMAVPFQFENPIVLHPTLIEPCLQSISPALINGELNTTTVLRHQSIGNLRLSMDMTREPGTQFGVYSRLEKGAADKLSTSAFYLDKSHSSHIPGLEIDELVSTWESLNTTETDLKPRSLCYKTLWKPHPRFISPLYFQDRKGVMGQNSFHNFNGSRECNGDTSTNVAVLPPFPDDTSLPIAVASTISYIELLVHAKISRCSIIGTGEAFAAMCLRLLPILHGRVESVELGGISANAFSIISKRLSGLHVSCQISYKAFGETDSKGDDNTKNVDIAVITPSLRLSNQLEYSMDRVQTLLKEDGHLIIMRPNSTEAHPTDLPEPDVSEQLNGPANLRNGDVISFDEVQGMRLVSASNYCSDKAWDIKIFEKSPTPARDVSIKVITVDEVYPRESSSAPCRLDQIEPEDMVGQTCILLAMRSPLLQIPSSKIFKNLQGLASYCSTILWVIQGGYQDSTSPDTYMAAGLCRTLRWENPSLRCALLDLDGKHEELDNNALKVIKNVLQEVLTSDSELEFMERDGNVFVPRVVVDNTLNRYLYPESPLGPVLRLSLAESKNPLKMLHGSSLPGNEVIFVEDDIDGLPLDDDWVQIEVKSFPVASMDSITMQTHNSHELRCISSGVITKVGHNVESLGIGNRVYAVTTGEFSSVVRSPAKLVSCISDDMDFSEATSLLNTFTLVFYAMANANGLPREGSVLVHNASSRLGQAALKLLESTSTKVLATVNSVAGKVLIMNTYGVPEEHIFSREESSYPSGVLRATQGKGVDVVIDASRGDRVGDWEPCLNRSGRFVQLHQVQSRSQLPRLVKNQQFRSVDFITALVDQPDTVMSIASMILKQWSEGNLKPVRPLQKLSLSEYDQSLLLAQNANLVGDITIEVTRQEKVQAILSQPQKSLFHDNATYLITGGTGGLGRCLARWIVNQGGKHIVLASRSGMKNKHIPQLMDELTKKGAHIVVQQCDIQDPVQVKTLFRQISEDMPPLRGVVHAPWIPMYDIFERMSHENYLSAIQPKVDGVWNLHQQTLKSNLDFFVMMSSVHGIFGNRGQSSTAAAHTFLDAFMQYRLKQGLPAVTIDLPIIKEVGYMAENTETMELVSGIVFDSVNEAEFLSLMELAISETHSHHIITGLTVPSDQPQPFWMNDARFSHINQDNQLAKAKKSGKVASSEQALDVRAALQGVSSLDQAVSVVSLSILEKLSKLASVPLDELSKSSPLTDYGLDSISGIEMRNWIMRDLGAMIGLQDLLTASTVDALARKISEQSKLFPTFRNGI